MQVAIEVRSRRYLLDPTPPFSSNRDVPPLTLTLSQTPGLHIVCASCQRMTPFRSCDETQPILLFVMRQSFHIATPNLAASVILVAFYVEVEGLSACVQSNDVLVLARQKRHRVQRQLEFRAHSNETCSYEFFSPTMVTMRNRR